MKKLVSNRAREIALYAGAIFDLRGALCRRLLAGLEQRRRRMPRTTEEAMRRDWLSIGGDMRRALDAAKEVRARG